MNEDLQQNSVFGDDQVDFVIDLLTKAKACNEKTDKHANLDLYFPAMAGSFSMPCRVDDIKLLYTASRLIPNVVNYMLNNLPYLLYPYLVAYLQELSDDDNVVTLSQLYDLVVELEKDE